MIRSLELRNYRGFGEYRVEHVADVNLFVGRNNVGKTTLLEAAQLAHSTTPLTVLRRIAERRQEESTIPVDARGEAFSYSEVPDFSHVFYGRQLQPGSFVLLSGEGTPGLRLGIDVLEEDDDEEEGSGSFESTDSPPILLLTARRGGELVARGEIADDGLFLSEHRFGRFRSRRRSEAMVFITPDSLSANSLASLYNAVVDREAEDSLVQALQILDPKVSGVHFRASERTSGIDGGGGILIGRNGSGRSPIGSFGDGMRRLLALGMAFVNTSGGILLVDEVDTGLHYSVMPDLWRLILGSTEAFGIQAFATTHSLDCVRGLQEALEELPERAERVAVHKVDGRLDRAVTLTGGELIRALRADLELR